MLDKTDKSPLSGIIADRGEEMKKIVPDSNTSKYERINIIAQLIRNKPHSISQLSEKLGVSTKTIQRDLYDVLTDYGAVRRGRMWSMDDKDAKDNLTQEERIVLNVLDNISKSMGANFYSKAHILLDQITQQLNHPILTNINNEKLNEDDFINFELIEKSIKQKQEIACKYNDYEFKVKPLKLAMFDGFWYLLLLDSNKKDTFKKFHLRSISDIKILDDRFEISSEIENRIQNANSAWFDLVKPKKARLLLAPQITKYFERKPYAKQSITGKDNDGSVEVEIEYTNIMEIKPLIYYYIPFIKVLGPKELADTIKDEIGEYFNEIDI
ncbi:helix-turn-helix transcriptional regulator [Campylobacter sp. RM16187]|uniref:helix-turn-helix transcriptional regulator n=1 Tax=Campylobacter sp. RM16187 TaxID=1660063 RepID=UPI0021B53026|nr:WYL domain-containing protein [Campylobacter sp. RM16187]QKG28748.1 transcriptional regulator (WYL domain) [Campylobacter sp. RM16187]